MSFEVAYGEVFGFLGPNGAGKTTTVRTLGTLIAPTSARPPWPGSRSIHENGMEIRRRIAIMPEAPGLYLRLTVTENLEYFAGSLRAAQILDRGSRAHSRLSTWPTGQEICAAGSPRGSASGWVWPERC